MDAIRTPEERFGNLKDYPFDAHYIDVPAGDGSNLRMHYLDEGQGELILCMHFCVSVKTRTQALEPDASHFSV